jgi:hypothetical protein
MADLYRILSCLGCTKSHLSFDTSVVRYPPRGLYSYTCSGTRLLVNLRLDESPEVVPVLPHHAIPIVWVSG